MHHEIVAGGSGEDDDTRVIARLQERVSGSSKLVGCICEVLLIFMCVVVEVLFRDPIALLVQGWSV
uniref:Uncharacterized protein n=1 Tax=Oryza punctata TaxID=4537 RepID=A0A0E0LSY7_ORYPU